MQCSESIGEFHHDGPARLARPKRKTTSALMDVAESNAAESTYMYLRHQLDPAMGARTCDATRDVVAAPSVG